MYIMVSSPHGRGSYILDVVCDDACIMADLVGGRGGVNGLQMERERVGGKPNRPICHPSGSHTCIYGNK